MWDAITYLSIVVFLAVLVIVLGFFARGFMSGTKPGNALGALFGPKAERRLDILEQMTLDGRRQLILIRRDDIEHLILTGGPVDIVVETGISAPAKVGLASGPVDPTFSRDDRFKAPFGSDS